MSDELSAAAYEQISSWIQEVTNQQLELKQLVLGIGTGRTINKFIQASLPKLNRASQVTLSYIPSSDATKQQLAQLNLKLAEPEAWLEPNTPKLYIDSADAYNSLGQLVKGHGGALTREKILATQSDYFLCLVDQSKYMALGEKSLPLEILPFARGFIVQHLLKQYKILSTLRSNYVTNNNNFLLELNWKDYYQKYCYQQPGTLAEFEATLKLIPGVLESGIFAIRTADMLLSLQPDGSVLLKKA